MAISGECGRNPGESVYFSCALRLRLRAATGVRKGFYLLLSHPCGFGRVAPSPAGWANFFRASGAGFWRGTARRGFRLRFRLRLRAGLRREERNFYFVAKAPLFHPKKSTQQSVFSPEALIRRGAGLRPLVVSH